MGLDSSAARRVLAGLALLYICSVAGASAPDTAERPSGCREDCAGSNCHGNSAAELPSQGVLHNEYLTWQREDTHAGAFRSLLTPRALAIGKRLGIAEPSKSDTCIDCHTDDVPAAQRGPRFSLSDGIGCEACHGGSSSWIADHAVAHRSHPANIKGVSPQDPVARAGLCLGCHYGAADKLMTHAIMAAGHHRPVVRAHHLYRHTTCPSPGGCELPAAQALRGAGRYLGRGAGSGGGERESIEQSGRPGGMQEPAVVVPDFYL